MTRPAHRPPLPPEQRRTRRVEVALTDAEAEALAAIAKAWGKAQAEVLREGALFFHPRARPGTIEIPAAAIPVTPDPVLTEARLTYGTPDDGAIHAPGLVIEQAPSPDPAVRRYKLTYYDEPWDNWDGKPRMRRG